MRLLLTFGPGALLFGLAATRLIDLPGVYMDAVNTDYMVVHVLHPFAANLPGWWIPGNMVLGRFPVLGGVYYGALPFYLGLPFYWVFGTGVEGIRLTNMVFGLVVLAAGAVFLRAWNVRPLIVAIAMGALALDPAFLFVWRTQFNITLLPLAPLLASVALTQSAGEAASRRTAALAGLLAGIACYGYFIFGFLVPAAFVHAWIVSGRSKRFTAMWLTGFAVGVAPYALAALLLWRAAGSAADSVAYIRGIIGVLQPGQSHLTLFERFTLFLYDCRQSVLGVGPEEMMIQRYSSIAPMLRLIVLFGVPLCGIGLWAAGKAKPPGLLVLAGFVAGLFCLAMTFGNRLWLHHFAVLIPILYLACAGVAEAITRLASSWAWGRAIAVAAPLSFGLLLGLNAADANEVFGILNRTKGVGLYSDAFDRFAIDSLSVKDPTFYFFPDWGVFMSFVMLTHGTLPYSFDFDVNRARSLLCANQDVAVVLVMDKEPDRLQTWTDALGWAEPVLSSYRQPNAVNILTVARWKAAARGAGACK